MRQTRHSRGVTLIELVVAIVIVGIVVAAVMFFLNPLRQSTDLALRAELTDIADNALQRIGRDVKLALPNSVRVHASGRFVEFMAVRTAGRYRNSGGGSSAANDCPAADPSLGTPGNDELSFDTVVDGCFKSIGNVANADQIVANGDWLVLNNFGEGFPGQDVYAAGNTADADNHAEIDAVDHTTEAGRERIEFTRSTPFSRERHDSPGKRFFIVSGPVTYECDLVSGRILRHAGYAPSATQPTVFAGGAVLAEHVRSIGGCLFEYSIVGPQLGLLTMRITLQRSLFGGASETVSLYHAVHVNNSP